MDDKSGAFRDSGRSGPARSVALYSPGWPPGRVQNGIVTYVGELAPALARLGLQTHIVTPLLAPDAPRDDAIDLSKLPRLLRRRLLFRAAQKITQAEDPALVMGWQTARGLAQIEARHGLDLVEIEESFGGALYLQELISAPVVVRLHGPWFVNGAALGLPVDETFRSREKIERLCITSALGVTSPSRDLLERVRREYGMALPHAAVIPNSAPRIASERRWRLDGCDKKTVLFVGRFDRHKGGDIMIDAFGQLAKALPEVELVFVGPDRGFRDDAGTVRDIASFLDLRLPPEVRNRVHVRGPLPADQIENLRRQAFVTAVPSRYENFGLALLESLSFGCPTVASDVGGNVEILLDERTGVLCRTGDPSDLAAKMLELFRHPETAAAFGERAAVDMSERFAPESVARSTLEYYETVWRSPARPRTGVGSRVRRALYGLSGRA